MRIIAHLDMDAFFAAIEERDHPRLKGKPIVVGADPEGGKGRGVVSTANYKAREYGIKSALPISAAWRLSEQAKAEGKPAANFFEGNFQKYGKVSGEVMAIVAKYSPSVEQASVDEAYFDLSFCKNFQEAAGVAKKIKAKIKKEERLTASVGIGPNKLIAKIASDMQKPDGLTVVQKEDAEKFLEPLNIRKIPGVGPKTEILFKKERISIVGDLKKYSEKQLSEMLGKWGMELFKKIRGIDDSPIELSYEAKSIGEQETFSVDTKDATHVMTRLKALCAGVAESFLESDFDSFRTIGITVRFGDFETKTRAFTLKEKVSRSGDLFKKPEKKEIISKLEFEAIKLISPFLDARENPKRKNLRLIGVRIEKLS